jgi:hypothetical protein
LEERCHLLGHIGLFWATLGRGETNLTALEQIAALVGSHGSRSSLRAAAAVTVNLGRGAVLADASTS